MAKDLFRVLKDKCGPNLNTLVSQKITVVAGDITCENLGVKDINLVEEMWREVDVVVNLAATTKFDERYIVFITCFCSTNYERYTSHIINQLIMKFFKFFL